MAHHKDTVLVSIVIPVSRVNKYLIACIRAIESGSYNNYEIIVVTDHKEHYTFLKTRLFVLHSGPSQKRDFGALKAKGKILAFIDDDTQPSYYWLQNIVSSFSDDSIVAVGGPGITPQNADWREKASGWALASPLGAGAFTYRFIQQQDRYVDDYPSMNLAVKKTAFDEVGGFDSHYYPGEDTKLCLDLTHSLHKKIRYASSAAIFHHRRPFLIPHLMQQGNYGLHRGFFARVLPQTSFRLIYFIPSFLLLYCVGYAIFIIGYNIYFSSLKFAMVSMPLLFYFVLVVCNSLWVFRQSRSLFQSALSCITVFLTHLWYGARFMQGFLLTLKLER